MSRRRKAQKRELIPDPRYSDIIVSKFSIFNVSMFLEKATLIKNIMINKKLYLTKLIKFDLTYYWVKYIEFKFCCYH